MEESCLPLDDLNLFTSCSFQCAYKAAGDVVPCSLHMHISKRAFQKAADKKGGYVGTNGPASEVL